MRQTAFSPFALPFPACLLSHCSHVGLFSTPWAEASQAPLSMEFSRQEYWRGVPSPPPGDPPKQGSTQVSHIPCIVRQFLYH